MARALTIKALAAGCEVSTRTINTWLDQGCPRTSIAEALAWKADHVLPRKGGPRTRRESTGDRRQRSLQERTLRANARKAEQDARFRRIKALFDLWIRLPECRHYLTDGHSLLEGSAAFLALGIVPKGGKK